MEKLASLLSLLAVAVVLQPFDASAQSTQTSSAKNQASTSTAKTGAVRAKPASSAPLQPASPPKPVVPTLPPIPDLTRSNFIQQMDAEYRKRDLDGDGKVTRAELEQFERAQALTQAQANNRALFLKLDVDRNGSISPGEFAALVQDPGTPDVTPLMQRFDSNKDQIISIVEYRGATLVNFDRLDADKDGVVTDAEVKAGAPKLMVPGGR